MKFSHAWHRHAPSRRSGDTTINRFSIVTQVNGSNYTYKCATIYHVDGLIVGKKNAIASVRIDWQLTSNINEIVVHIATWQEFSVS